MESFTSGEVVGNGAAINVEIGWIPDRVEVYNATDGDLLTVGFLNRYVIPFSSGGVVEIEAGDTITGITNTKVTAVVKSVLLYSGTWAGGDAAGFFIVEFDNQNGTFGSEGVSGSASAAANNDATVTVNLTHGFASAAAVSGEDTGNAALLPYAGTTEANSKGFTIGATVAEEAKLLRWAAWRNDR